MCPLELHCSQGMKMTAVANGHCCILISGLLELPFVISHRAAQSLMMAKIVWDQETHKTERHEELPVGKQVFTAAVLTRLSQLPWSLGCREETKGKCFFPYCVREKKRHVSYRRVREENIRLSQWLGHQLTLSYSWSKLLLLAIITRCRPPPHPHPEPCSYPQEVVYSEVSG